ncbi:ABC transporter substrate-binding protein [Undibacterium terreum]|uniref:Heme-binding protein n=1 Tax=Undibacterium terreum TaxID=1224302 RepID=A0A916XB65_9BURK|nr:ABC transporter substrate-binding protein [Undibacterium terreum]GGC60933.1 heme-binding protein [Undibacterium terreum]
MIFCRLIPVKTALLCLALSGLVVTQAALAAGTDKESRTLHVMLTTQEAALDPAVASDLASLSINENIFDPMLRYDYLARPVKLMPNTLAAMPEISDSGKTYTMRIQPGSFFTPDAAFKGKQRELTAQDYLYSIKRLYDPALKSPWLFMFEGKLLGDEKLKAGGKFDIDQAIEGIQAVDRYTLRIRLKAPDTNFLFQLATSATGAVAREVAETYGDQVGSHPVGTGPFMMGKWQRSFQIELLANPGYRNVVFSSVAGKDARDNQIVSDLQGKRLPRVDRVEIRIMEEAQSQVLGFLNNEFDYLEQVPPPLAEMVLVTGVSPHLKPELQKKGVQLDLFSTLQTYYVWMNMDDPVIGGYTPDKIALRRAIALSYNSKEDISLMERGLAIAAQTPLPPNVLGYDPAYRSPLAYDIRLANALLDKFGYKRAADGYRSLPDGQPLSLVMHSLASTKGRLRDETWRKNLDALGIRISFKSDKNSEILKAARLGKVQMTEANWIADFPDGENFYQLLYGPNSGRANYARFNLPAFNQLYEKSRTLSDSPERQRLYHDMAQLMHAYTPWIVRIHPLSADVWHPWLKDYKRHPVDFTTWRYLDVDNAAKAQAK